MALASLEVADGTECEAWNAEGVTVPNSAFITWSLLGTVFWGHTRSDPKTC